VGNEAKPRDESAPAPRSKAADDKEQRLAAALRANLRRRKQAAKPRI
jgi:hypothetical protein